MTTTALQLLREAERADTINKVQKSLTDSTKALTADVLNSLLTLAKGRDSDGNLLKQDWDLKRLAQSEASHWVALELLTAQVSAHAHNVEVLTNRLNDIRTYLRVGTAEQLSAALTAGKSIPINEAALTDAQRLAIERAKKQESKT